MALRTYEFFQEKYESTKPIRGRSEDIRPINNRRRDWELITKKELPDGTIAYGAQLYRTEVVRYLPNGNIQLRIDTWATPITAAFMSMWSPFNVRKASKNLWVGVYRSGGKEYPIPKQGMLEFKPVGSTYELVSGLPETLKQTVVDRTLSKELRLAYKPFIDYATTFLKLSDGWVMHDTLAHYKVKDDSEYTGWRTNFNLPMLVTELLRHKSYYADKPTHVFALKEMAQSNDPDQWDRLMLGILFHTSNTEEERRVSDETFTYNKQYIKTRRCSDYRFSVDAIKRFVDYLIKKDPTIYTTRDVEVGCVHHNLVI